MRKPRNFDKSIEKVPGGCWLWRGYCDKDGYGKFSIHSHHFSVHRLAWEKAYGEIPDGMSVLHRCDVPNCLNPDHLFLGTQADNIADKVMKGRQAFGDRHGMSKLTNKQRDEILSLKGTVAMKTTAFLYGVTPQRVHQIWKSH